MIAVLAVIYNENGKLLLIQEAKESCRGKWFFPGGRLNIGESIIDGIHREIKEEAGIKVELSGILYIDQKSTEINDRMRIVFSGKALSEKVKESEDSHSIGASWFGINEIDSLDHRSPFVRKIITVLRSNKGYLDIKFVHILSQDEIKNEMP
jgi:ADP-ribose pyrophosphatase YjhB (NUDIX family)